MIRILHAADFHLDSPFSSLSPEQAAERRAEQRALLTELFEAANHRQCDLVLLSGDIFDSENVCPDSVDALRRAMSLCTAQIFIAPGNHDYLADGSVYLTGSWPENVHIFRSGRIEAVSLPALGCRVFGAGFTGKAQTPLLTGFRAPEDGLVNLMVLHGDALNADSPYNPISRADIAASGLHYLALGHIHAASGLLRAGGCFYAWPGCLMGRGFDETGQKGALVLEVSQNDCQAEFLPIGSRKYEILRIDAGQDAADAIERALSSHTQNDSYRIILTGEAAPFRPAELYARFASRFFSLSIRDETVPARDLWEGMQEDTLRGHFLRTLRLQYDAADKKGKALIALAARYGTAAMDGREEPL